MSATIDMSNRTAVFVFCPSGKNGLVHKKAYETAMRRNLYNLRGDLATPQTIHGLNFIHPKDASWGILHCTVANFGPNPLAYILRGIRIPDGTTSRPYVPLSLFSQVDELSVFCISKTEEPPIQVLSRIQAGCIPKGDRTFWWYEQEESEGEAPEKRMVIPSNIGATAA